MIPRLTADTCLRRSVDATALLAAAALAIGLAAGCASSSPDIPENSGESKAQYQSTSGQQSSSSKSSTESKSTSTTSGSSTESSPSRRKLATGGSSSASGSSKSGETSLPKATGPVAHVNGDPISASKFNDQINKLSKSRQLSSRRLRRMTPQLVDKLIDQRLVENYLDEHGVEIADERVDKRLEKVREQFKKANQSSSGKIQTLEDARSQMGISDEELRDSIRQSIAIEDVLTKKRNVTLPTDKEVRSFYETNKHRFQRPERVKASHIIIKVPQEKQKDEKAWKKAKKKAQKIYKKAKKEKTDFAELAKKHSEGPTADKGGDLGYFTKQGMRGLEEFADAAFEMKNGEISEPVKTQFGWHIIKKTGHKSAGTVPFKEVEDKIYRSLKNRTLKKELQKLVSDLRDRAKIEKHPDNIE